MVVVGSAEFVLSADSARLLGDLAKAEAATRASAQRQAQAIAKASGTSVADVKRAADQMAAQQKRIEEANRRAAESFNGGAKSAVGYVGALVGIGGAAAATIAAIKGIATATQEQAQAQFAINKLYGQAAPLITAQAEALAKSSGRSKSEALEAAAAVANLGRQYAFSAKQQEQVLKISADLAAVKGLTLEEATKRISDAMRGEAEAAEYLGQVLNNDAVKAFAKMTDEQRKNFETLSPITKAQITLGKLLGDNNDLVGAAAERANSAVGAYDKLKASVTDLGVEIGKTLTPAFLGSARAIDSNIETLTNFIKKVNEVRENNARYDADQERRRQDALRRRDFGSALGIDPLADDPNRAALAAQSAPRNSLPPGEDLPAAQLQAATATAAQVEETKRRLQRQQALEQDAIKAFVDERKKAIDTVADAREKDARAEAKAADEAIEREKIRLNVEMEGRLKALAVRERATIRAIEAEQRAEEKASQANIERLEREKDARLAAAEAARDQAEQAIDNEERRLEHVREIEDRAVSDARKQEDRAVEDRRRAEDRSRENALRAEIDAIEKAHDARAAALEAEIAQHEKATEKRLRALDREADRARANSERAIRGIEQQADAEDERHRAAMQALEDEQDARLDALDAQLKALDAQEKQLDAAERLANLQRRASDAERALTKAKGSGDQQALTAARQALQDAIRRNDQAAALRARRDIEKAAGTGNPEEIEKAERDLADARADIEKENVKTAADARKDELKAAQDAIRDEIEARKRAEDERNRERKRDLDGEKQNEQDKLKTRIDAIGKRKQAAQDQAKEEIKLLRNTLEEEKRVAQEAVETARLKYADQKQVLDDQRRDEDRARDDRRQKEDQDRDDYREAEDERLRLQKEAVQKAYDDERKATEDLYNGPNGLVTQARKAQDAMKEAHRLRLDDTKLKFNEEREAIKAVYRNTERTGLLDLQDQAAENNRNKLADQLSAIASWKEQSGEWIDENKGKWKDLGTAIDEVAAKIKNLPRSRVVTVDPDTGINSQGGVGNAPYGPNEGGGRGEALPPPSIPPSGGSSAAPAPTKIPSQINQYTYDDLSRLEQDAACGPATIGWFSSMLGRSLTGRQAASIAKAAGWDTKTGMYGPGAMSAALSSVGVPNTVNWKVTEELIDGLARRKIPFALSTGEHYYQVYGGSVDGLNVGGSGLALRNGSSVMSLAAIRARGYEPQAVIIPDESVIHTRDGGYLFTEPTMTIGMRSGMRNLIAERRPELLVNGARTADLIGAGPMPDYGRMSDLATAAWSGRDGGPGGGYTDARVIQFNGSTDIETYRKFRSWDAREKALSAGRRRGPR